MNILFIEIRSNCLPLFRSVLWAYNTFVITKLACVSKAANSGTFQTLSRSSSRSLPAARGCPNDSGQLSLLPLGPAQAS